MWNYSPEEDSQRDGKGEIRGLNTTRPNRKFWLTCQRRAMKDGGNSFPVGKDAGNICIFLTKNKMHLFFF